MLGKIKMVVAAVLALSVLIVVLQNTETVETKMLFFTIAMPRAALLFGTLFIGFALGVIAAGRLAVTKKAE